MRKVAHIVNPVLVDESSDLSAAQPITFETMRIARRFAVGRLEVELLSAQYPEDHPVLPPDFRHTPDLQRSVLDVASFRRPRKLPLIRDILDRLYEATDAEYLIYTNVDIGLMPHFYATVGQFIDAGYDAFVINRRTLSIRYSEVEQIPLMYADMGDPHRGWDCFVFRRDAYPAYNLGAVCLAAPRVGLALVGNLVAHADKFKEFRDEHLTFHIGNDRDWRGSPYADYAQHNSKEALRILAELERERGAFERTSPPGAFLAKHRSFGVVYEWFVDHVHIPLKVRRWFIREGQR